MILELLSKAVRRKEITTSETPVVIFVHVPKTAGTSFYDLIEKNYPKKGRFVFNINKGKNPIPKLMKMMHKGSIKIIYGHGTFGLKEIYPQAKYVTFIRHPVSHTLSNYHYIRTSPHNRFHEQVKQMSFSEFILNLENIQHDNQHYRQITNNLFRIEHPEFYSKKIVPDYHLLEYGLNTIDYFFKFEEIDLAVDKLAREFNWKYSQLQHKNVSAKEDLTVTEKDIENILAINHLDWHIYRRAESLASQNQD